MTEDDLLGLIYEADRDARIATRQMSEAQERYTKAETDLIGAKLYKEQLTEQLRVLKSKSLNAGLSEREQEIAAFKERLPFIKV